MPKTETRIRVQKTYKLFIGGKFVRGENGRVLPARDSQGDVLANYCRASRKDFRDAVLAARKAQPGWAKSERISARPNSVSCRGNAGDAERRTARWRLRERPARPRTKAARKRHLVIDRLVHFAGWTDKYFQIFSTVNPVASSHFNFTMPEPTGVVVVVCPDEPPLLALVSLVAAGHRSGNCVIVLPSPTKPLPALTFSEIIATSDLPGGVVNILAGDRAELAPHFASHMDVNAIVDASGDEKIGSELQRGGSLNVKRYVSRDLTPAAWPNKRCGESVLDSRHSRDEDGLASDRTLRSGARTGHRP